jgi:hypothetical protein
MIVAGTEASHDMLLEHAADKVIKNYQTAAREQLPVQRSEPPSAMDKKAIEFLRYDSQAQGPFIDRIVVPGLNRMSGCGLILSAS